MHSIRTWLRLAIAIAGLGILSGTAGAQTFAALPAAVPAAVTGEAKPVAAWVEWCRRMPADCAVNPAEPATVTLTATTWRTIVSVNRTVNRKIQPLTDQEHWGVLDSWDLPTDGYGDCEDYQLLKRRLLVEAGLPRRALRMTVVVDEKGEGHAVLMVRTDRGDYVLDNKTDTILPWHQTGYTYVKREGHDSTAWVSLGGARSPTVTANR
ncbi:transglutaminase-like cysteine peptidase [Salinarimonas soli]|uniref:Transglutaminase-like cysteine peptidase n=1 Tax=Salinarimonas soli TaxID=1638099 RepID=A0A5B2VUB3_9HYPH|nr:transglutaminase-like cysteine peptidase [Salinarimonas soli]KAA2242198.1 transglutaminase-like cysteine peptidase [Salinarimonas soli]